MYQLRLLAVVHKATKERAAMETPHPLSTTWHRVFNPSVFGFLGLAIAVFLWGYNYKLSLYHLHPDAATRTQVAKLWVEQRNVAATAVPRQGVRAHKVSASQALLACELQHDLLRSAGVRGIVATHRRRDVTFGSLIPLRSPPFKSFSA